MEQRIDRRPVFTIGQVWTEFVKRLPRTYPKYKRLVGEVSFQQSTQSAYLQAIQYQQYAQQAQYTGPCGSSPYMGVSLVDWVEGYSPQHQAKQPEKHPQREE
jgi:hypothetical protein